jgi:site-specific recombinase XerD
MSLYKRDGSKFWWMKFTFDGELVQQSTKVANKRDALQIEAAFRHELALGRIGITPKVKAPTLKKACDGFLARVAVEHPNKAETIRRYTSNVKVFLQFFGEKVACDKITSEMVEQFKHHRATHISPKIKRKLKPITVNHELLTLRMIFNRLVDLDVMPKSPARKVKLLDNHITPTRILTFDEQKIYLMACAQPLRDVAVMMIELGLRPSEVLNLKRDDISLSENCLQVQEGKTKNARRKLPLSIESRRVLEYRLQTATGENLFPNTKVTYLDQLHTKALKALGIKPFTDEHFVLYSLRHCFASRHTENQTDMITLSELLGHGDLKTLKRYAHPSFEHKSQAIKRVEKLNAKAV